MKALVGFIVGDLVDMLSRTNDVIRQAPMLCFATILLFHGKERKGKGYKTSTKLHESMYKTEGQASNSRLHLLASFIEGKGIKPRVVRVSGMPPRYIPMHLNHQQICLRHSELSTPFPQRE